MKLSSSLRLSKAAVAAVVGCSLLLGGGTYALWTTQTSVASKATVSTGDLKATLEPGSSWSDVTDASAPTSVDLTSYRLAPGSKLKLEQNVNVVAVGNSLLATLHVRLPNTTASQALQSQAVFTVSVYDKANKQIATVTPTTNSSDSLKLDIGKLPRTSTDGDRYRVEITVTLPAGADNATKLQVGSLGDLSIGLEQTAVQAYPPASPISDFVYSTGTDGSSSISAYRGTSLDVVIPETITTGGKTYTVTSVKANAFDGKKLSSVRIPDAVASIGDYAFRGNNLTELKLPAQLTTLGGSAFTENKLTSVKIPEGVTRIENSTFKQNQITSIELPSNLTYLGYGAFWTNKLTQITIPKAVKYIGDDAFYNNAITTVTIPSSVVSIGRTAFFSVKTAYFEGNAPAINSISSGYGSFGLTATGKTLYYHKGATGFTSPTWSGYTTAIY